MEPSEILRERHRNPATFNTYTTQFIYGRRGSSMHRPDNRAQELSRMGLDSEGSLRSCLGT